MNRKWRTLLVAVLIVLAGCGKGSLPHEDKNVAELERMLHDADPNVQSQGALGLSLLGPEAKSAVPSLVPLLRSPHSLVRQNAALALCKIGPEAREAVPALIETLQDKEWPVRRQAAAALAEMGPSAQKALPALERLKDKDPDSLVRGTADSAAKKIRGGTSTERSR
jgi:HEAT repeat protein